MFLISDLHLEPSRDDITRALVRFLRQRAIASSQLYILGDLFEVWIGDDASNPLADLVASELSELAARGCEVFLMHGNRDFLMGSQFAGRCRAKLIDEPLVVERGHRRLALLHGDVLCTRDTDYLKFRAMVRNPDWQRDFLSRPLPDRQEFARQARQISQQTTGSMTAEIMDVTDTAVCGMFRDLQVHTMIHGHTHRPARHDVDLSGSGALVGLGERIVLGDWHKTGWYASVDNQGQVLLETWQLA